MRRYRKEQTMFEQFTDPARLAVVLAQDEAKMLNHNYIGTEHLLLGILCLSEREEVNVRLLGPYDISPDQVRERVEEIIGRGQEGVKGRTPFTPRVQRVFQLSLEEAKQLGHFEIGVAHLLLGIMAEGEGIAAQILLSLGVDLDTARGAVLSDFLTITPEARAKLIRARETVAVARRALSDAERAENEAFAQLFSVL